MKVKSLFAIFALVLGGESFSLNYNPLMHIRRYPAHNNVELSKKIDELTIENQKLKRTISEQPKSSGLVTVVNDSKKDGIIQSLRNEIARLRRGYSAHDTSIGLSKKVDELTIENQKLKQTISEQPKNSGLVTIVNDSEKDGIIQNLRSENTRLLKWIRKLKTKENNGLKEKSNVDITNEGSVTTLFDSLEDLESSVSNTSTNSTITLCSSDSDLSGTESSQSSENTSKGKKASSPQPGSVPPPPPPPPMPQRLNIPLSPFPALGSVPPPPPRPILVGSNVTPPLASGADSSLTLSLASVVNGNHVDPQQQKEMRRNIFINLLKQELYKLGDAKDMNTFAQIINLYLAGNEDELWNRVKAGHKRVSELHTRLSTSLEKIQKSKNTNVKVFEETFYNLAEQVKNLQTYMANWKSNILQNKNSKSSQGIRASSLKYFKETEKSKNLDNDTSVFKEIYHAIIKVAIDYFNIIKEIGSTSVEQDDYQILDEADSLLRRSVVLSGSLDDIINLFKQQNPEQISQQLAKKAIDLVQFKRNIDIFLSAEQKENHILLKSPEGYKISDRTFFEKTKAYFEKGQWDNILRNRNLLNTPSLVEVKIDAESENIIELFRKLPDDLEGPGNLVNRARTEKQMSNYSQYGAMFYFDTKQNYGGALVPLPAQFFPMDNLKPSLTKSDIDPISLQKITKGSDSEMFTYLLALGKGSCTPIDIYGEAFKLQISQHIKKKKSSENLQITGKGSMRKKQLSQNPIFEIQKTTSMEMSEELVLDKPKNSCETALEQLNGSIDLKMIPSLIRGWRSNKSGKEGKLSCWIKKTMDTSDLSAIIGDLLDSKKESCKFNEVNKAYPLKIKVKPKQDKLDVVDFRNIVFKVALHADQIIRHTELPVFLKKDQAKDRRWVLDVSRDASKTLGNFINALKFSDLSEDLKEFTNSLLEEEGERDELQKIKSDLTSIKQSIDKSVMKAEAYLNGTSPINGKFRYEGEKEFVMINPVPQSNMRLSNRRSGGFGM